MDGDYSSLLSGFGGGGSGDGQTARADSRTTIYGRDNGGLPAWLPWVILGVTGLIVFVVILKIAK